MYATRLVPSVPCGIAGPMAPRRVVVVVPSIRYGLYFYLVLCLVAGFVIGLCLDRMFELSHDWEGPQVRITTGCRVSSPTDMFCADAELDTSLIRTR